MSRKTPFSFNSIFFFNKTFKQFASAKPGKAGQKIKFALAKGHARNFKTLSGGQLPCYNYLAILSRRRSTAASSENFPLYSNRGNDSAGQLCVSFHLMSLILYLFYSDTQSNPPDNCVLFFMKRNILSANEVKKLSSDFC